MSVVDKVLFVYLFKMKIINDFNKVQDTQIKLSVDGDKRWAVKVTFKGSPSYN